MTNIDQPIFPLLLLPKKAQKHVCRFMEPINQQLPGNFSIAFARIDTDRNKLTLSICHEVTKNLVKSSGLKCTRFDVPGDIILEFGDRRHVSICFDNDCRELDFTSVRAYNFWTFRNYGYETNNVWRRPQFTVRDWTAHLLWVLNRTNLSFLWYANDGLEYFQRNFIGFNLDYFYIEEADVEDAVQLVKSFPCMKRLELKSDIPEVEFRKVLVQNFDFLEVSNRITLNDLLLVNSVQFEHPTSKLRPKEINRFLKIWMRGAVPRLKCIRLQCSLNQEEDLLSNMQNFMKGIDFRIQTEDKAFYFYTGVMRMLKEHTVTGGTGIEIRRKDGTRATTSFFFIEYTTEFWFRMDVWS